MKTELSIVLVWQESQPWCEWIRYSYKIITSRYYLLCQVCGERVDNPAALSTIEKTVC